MMRKLHRMTMVARHFESHHSPVQKKEDDSEQCCPMPTSWRRILWMSPYKFNIGANYEDSMDAAMTQKCNDESRFDES
ncbi:hypothetical protein DdX_15635 [Ditylenchus destructor]|uniref:Uncharacterized protein n=1 Tax=Ditylenchus destructor TaxID=166010 RepID=A0AAD4MR40_9BILA|nr:hypothetical protein DdX_15635 [Ditylenchus destructor]